MRHCKKWVRLTRHAHAAYVRTIDGEIAGDDGGRGEIALVIPRICYWVGDPSVALMRWWRCCGFHAPSATAILVCSAATILATASRPIPLTAPVQPCRVVDGAVDASQCGGGFDPANSTLALRSALASGAHTIRVPAMDGQPWHLAPIPGVDPICPVDPKEWGHCPALHLFNLTDLTLILEPGTVLLAIRNAFHNPAAAMIRVEHCHNLSIVGVNATIRMWREDYANPAQYIHSETRGGLAIYDSSAISIAGLAISYTGGDGIYLCVDSSGATTHRCINCIVAKADLAG